VNHDGKVSLEITLGIPLVLGLCVTSLPCIISTATVIPPGNVKSTSNAGGVTTAFTFVLHVSNAFNAAITIRSSAIFSLRKVALANGCDVNKYSNSACGCGIMNVGS
jgi:hypothetical protein